MHKHHCERLKWGKHWDWTCVTSPEDEHEIPAQVAGKVHHIAEHVQKPMPTSLAVNEPMELTKMVDGGAAAAGGGGAMSVSFVPTSGVTGTVGEVVQSLEAVPTKVLLPPVMASVPTAAAAVVPSPTSAVEVVAEKAAGPKLEVDVPAMAGVEANVGVAAAPVGEGAVAAGPEMVAAGPEMVAAGPEAAPAAPENI
ncbi:hypothetical protein HDU98_006487 [Podochytrium sp. JEL0797]|nr:hypothetical protein HDU98_006487 [Podochytrium sp. JEL0797]